MTSAPAIGFDYRPSFWLVGLVTLVAVLASVALALCGAPGKLKLALIAGTVMLAGAGMHRARRSSVTGVACGPGGWALYQADRSQLPALLLSHRVIGTCVLLRLRTDRFTETLLLAPDNSDADMRRRLRMRLAAPSAAADAR